MKARRTAWLATLLIGAVAGPAQAQFTPPRVSFGFFGTETGDTDPSPFVTTEASTLSVGGGGLVYSGWGSAHMPDGTLKVIYDERYNVPGGNVAFDSTGHASVAQMFDTLVAGADGTLTLTLSGHALLAWSNVVIPFQTDNSWAGYGFFIAGQVFNPGGGGLVGGGGQARSSVDFDSFRPAPSTVASDAGAAGVHKAVDASFVLTPDGGVLTLTAWVNAGDRFNFTASAAGRGWADRILGGYASADLSHTASLAISGSPGMTWTAESGALLSPVPEPGAWAMLLAGLGAVGFVSRRRA